MSQRVLFEIEDDDPELTADDRDFVARLNELVQRPADDSVHGEAFHDDEDDLLIGAVSLFDPEENLHLAAMGVYVGDGRVRGDRFDQNYEFRPAPTPFAMDVTGDRDELVRSTAEWFTNVLQRPIVLYVWLHDRYAYAARYLFADTGETLCQSYSPRFAPPGQEKRLVEEGHVYGKGWIQTTGLPDPSLYLHIRGDLERAALPSGVPKATERAGLPRPWYE
ncbi:MAG TPA: hypothetical protein VIL71_04250 [Spirillospora sp.]